MDASRRLIGVSAEFSGNDVVGADVAGIIRRLLLFDQYVLSSIRLKEFPFLASRIGYTGLRDLLKAGMIQIRCECLQIAQIGQSGLLGDPILPPYFFKFNWIDIADREVYLHQCLQSVHDAAGIKHSQAVKLKKTIVDSLVPIPQFIRPRMFPAFESELLHNESLLRIAINMVIEKEIGAYAVPYSLKVTKHSDEVYHVESDLALVIKKSDDEAHRLIERGIMAVASLTQHVCEMKAYGALSGFRDEELPLFNHLFLHLAGANKSETAEGQFQRVIEIADLGELPIERTLDVERLIKIRESRELVEFKEFLRTANKWDDERIRREVAGVRAKLGLIVNSPIAEKVKFLINAAADFIPGHAWIAGAVIGGLEKMLCGVLFQESAVAAFVNRSYRSLFKARVDGGEPEVKLLDAAQVPRCQSKTE